MHPGQIHCRFNFQSEIFDISSCTITANNITLFDLEYKAKSSSRDLGVRDVRAIKSAQSDSQCRRGTKGRETNRQNCQTAQKIYFGGDR